MELVTVGTGTVAPSASRTSACHWVARGSLKILLDCGAGTLHRLAEFGLPWHQVSHVILSHFHPDHWGELPMLVYAQVHDRAAAQGPVRHSRAARRRTPAAHPGRGLWRLAARSRVPDRH